MRTGSNQTAKWIAIAVVGLAVVVAAVALGPRLGSLFAPPIPTPQCVQPMLTLGTTQFQIQSIARAADGSVVVPPDRSDVAYWVEGTNINYVFALNPTSNSLTLKDVLKQNEVAKIVWADCGADEYVVKSIEAGVRKLRWRNRLKVKPHQGHPLGPRRLSGSSSPWAVWQRPPG